MHIIYTTKIYLPHIGGVELYIKKLADYFISKGNSVTVITADEESSHLLEENENGIKVIRIPTKSVSGVFLVKNQKDLKIIKQELALADIVHVNDCKFLFHFFAHQKKQYGYKLVCSSQGWLFHTKNHLFIKKIYFKCIVAKNAHMYDKIICISEQDKLIAQKYGILCDTIIYPGVDCKKYSDLPKKKICENVFFYWGRISQNKGILEALKKLNTLKEDYSVIIAGKCEDNNYLNILNGYITDNYMKERVKFIGQISDADVKENIINSDFVLMPSLHEGFGITLVECLLSGRSIIANRNESYVEILTKTDATEFLFDFEDETIDFQKKISELKIKNVFPKNIAQFSDEHVQSLITSIYEEICHK